MLFQVESVYEPKDFKEWVKLKKGRGKGTSGDDLIFALYLFLFLICIYLLMLYNTTIVLIGMLIVAICFIYSHSYILMSMTAWRKYPHQGTKVTYCFYQDYFTEIIDDRETRFDYLEEADDDIYI